MTHQEQNKSGLSILQEAINDGDDAIQLLLQHTIQRVLEEEITAYLVAGTYERTDTRKGYRNGYKHRTLKTRVGRIEFMVPKDREGRFQTELFEKYQRNEKALTLAIMEMYVQGVSTRKVKNITEELCGLDISRSQVSKFLDTYGEELLAVYSLPESHRKRMRSTNMLERYNQEIKRHTRVVRIFPNEQSCVRLVTALAFETNEELMARRYLTKDNEKGGSNSTTYTIAA